MKRLDIFAIGAALVFLTGCPYNANHQLGGPSTKTFDAALLGTWTGCSAENKTDCGRLVIYRFNETEYYIEMTGVEHTISNQNININTDRYRAFMTDIGVPGLLDAQELSLSTAAPAGHLYLKAEALPDETLKLSYMSDNFAKAKFAAAEELAAYIRENHAKPGFYETLPVFERLKTK